jgi:AAA domain, putative AbiEii toxin, Type IV TA system
MARLSVRGFICIDEADLDLSPFTVLIGPQGSGKSIIAKLVYFCYEHLISWVRSPDSDEYISDFSHRIAEQFASLFPTATWGDKPFSISFVAGSYGLYLERDANRRSVQVSFSEALSRDYEALRARVQAALEGNPLKDGDPIRKRMELIESEVDAFGSRVDAALQTDRIHGLLFVPAGRTLFNYVGRAARASAGLNIPLDAITERFGSLVEIIRDMYARHGDVYDTEKDRDVMQSLFGGRLVFEKDANRLELNDGRAIPLSLLSSGLQELLPLWLAMRMGFTGSLMFIEEPEAHLFPTTQSKLIEVLADLVEGSSSPRLFVTTHSPYTLAKLNNLLKAGEVAALGDEQATRVSKIVPPTAWLSNRDLNAYAIWDRKLVRIMDDSGLIDGDYLDSISGVISDEFLDLLAIQYPESDDE